MTVENAISSLGEFELIRRFFASRENIAPSAMSVVAGIGDDAAVLAVPRTQHLLTSVDTLVEGIHFASDQDPFLVGCKALLVNISDMAAMGATPHCYLLSLSLPATTPLRWVEEFSRGLREIAGRFSLSLIGGDTVGSRGGVTVTISILGLTGQNRAIFRSGAQVGDCVFVSGSIGDATLGLAWSMGQLPWVNPDDGNWLCNRLDLPQPRVQLGKMLQDAAVAHAAIDISDGLVADLGHLGASSGVNVRIHAEKVPLSDTARRVIHGRDSSMLTRLLTGGEDYELAFAAPDGARHSILEISHCLEIPITEIGECVAGAPGVTLLSAGEPMLLEQAGWSHF
ncbi:MAG: thiamine-phosphate kinase [Magnetococcales bacterium]|nr:thiamine-phosphate kinase [Magnetococcales bacterium]MBF0322073.1 thiamine-phosphate kinase [Magnetococcales bacterium]